MTPAEEFRAAEERVRMGDRRIDIALRGPVAELLGHGLRSHEAALRAARYVWGDVDNAERRKFVEQVSGMAELLALARAINEVK